MRNSNSRGINQRKATITNMSLGKEDKNTKKCTAQNVIDVNRRNSLENMQNKLEMTLNEINIENNNGIGRANAL